jgi:hypothetical protein
MWGGGVELGWVRMGWVRGSEVGWDRMEEGVVGCARTGQDTANSSAAGAPLNSQPMLAHCSRPTPD